MKNESRDIDRLKGLLRFLGFTSYTRSDGGCPVVLPYFTGEYVAHAEFYVHNPNLTISVSGSFLLDISDVEVMNLVEEIWRFYDRCFTVEFLHSNKVIALNYTLNLDNVISVPSLIELAIARLGSAMTRYQVLSLSHKVKDYYDKVNKEMKEKYALSEEFSRERDWRYLN